MGKTTDPLLTMLRAIAQMRADTLHAPDHPVVGAFVAQTVALIRPLLQQHPQPIAQALVKALWLTGVPELVDGAHTYAQKACLKHIDVSNNQWALALRTLSPEQIAHTLHTGLIDSRGASIAIFGAMANGRKGVEVLLPIVQPYIRDLKILRKQYRSLLSHPTVISHIGPYLTGQIHQHRPAYEDYAKSALANGDIVGAMIVHLSGVPMATIDPPHKTLVTAHQQRFRQAQNTAHGKLALHHHAPTLQALLANQKSLIDWYHPGLIVPPF